MAAKDDKLEKDKLKVNDWKSFSMNPQSETDIKNKILTDRIDSVCSTYICRYSRLSEDFIEELRGLSTGLLKKDRYYSENLKTILDALDKKQRFNSSSYYKKQDDEKLGKITLKYIDIHGTYTVTKAISGIRDRIDWTYISQYQVLSEQFILKHGKDVHWGFIFKSQNVSKEFRKKYGSNASIIDSPIESEE